MLTQHFAPELTAGRFRLEAIATCLVERGHEVQVICPVPNHPRGIVEDGYRGRPVIRRTVEGSLVTYLRVVTSRRKTIWTRAGYYLSYAALASAVGAVRRSPDVVLASSPPLSVAAAGALLAARHRAPWVLDVRDLWPMSALTLGELRPGAMFAAGERLERFVYAHAAAMVTTNDAFRQWIEERAPAAARIEVVPNGTSGPWLRVSETEVERSSVGLPDDRFVLGYAGNIGLAHGLEVAADATRLLGRDYLLLVIGEGPKRSVLEQRAAEPGTSVEIRALMPPREAAQHLRAADAVLVSERQETTVSAKLYDACAVGRPVVAACRGELRRLVESEGIALAVPHGDAEALADAVRRLRSDSDLCEQLTERSLSFARRHRREDQAERVARLLEAVAAESAAPTRGT